MADAASALLRDFGTTAGPPANVLFRLTMRYATACTAIHVCLRPIVRRMPRVARKSHGDFLNRVVATLHAVVVSVACTRALIVEQPFADAWTSAMTLAGGDINFFAGHSRTLDFVLPISLGYFLYDAVLMLLDREIYMFAMMLHHVGALVTWPIAYLSDTHHFYLLYLLTTELSSPFLHQAVFFLPTLGLKGRPIHTFCGLALLVLFLVVRILPLPFMAWSVIGARGHFARLPTAFQYITIATFPIPAILNVLWFGKIMGAALASGGKKKKTSDEGDEAAAAAAEGESEAGNAKAKKAKARKAKAKAS